MNFINQDTTLNSNVENDRKHARRHSQVSSMVPQHLKRDIESNRNAHSSPYKGRYSDKDTCDKNQVCSCTYKTC